MKLRARARATLRERRLLPAPAAAHVGRPRVLLIGCSGGPDSTALVHVLASLAEELSLELHVASVDHRMRPEAAAEVAKVGALAASLGLPFHPLAVNVGEGASVQAHARAARYGAMLALAGDLGAIGLAVGHTADDQAETVLARLLRGAGLRGLGGIAPRRGDGVLRPLLDVRRAEVDAYLAYHHLVAVDDPSNSDRRHTRVRIRGILRALEGEDPRLVPHLCAVADDCRAAARALRALGAQGLMQARAAPTGAASRDDAAVDAATIAALPEAVRAEALRMLAAEASGRAPKRAQLRALEMALHGRGEARLSDEVSISPKTRAGRIVLETRCAPLPSRRRRS